MKATGEVNGYRTHHLEAAMLEKRSDSLEIGLTHLEMPEFKRTE